MEQRTFNYRSPSSLFGFGFLLLWSTGFGAGGVDVLITGQVTINDRPGTPAEAATRGIVMVVAALVGFFAAIRLLLTYLNERIVVGDGMIRWYDWRGAEKASGELAYAEPLRERPGMNGLIRASVKVGEREIRFNKTLEGYGILKELLTPSTDAGKPDLPAEKPTYTPAYGVYRYRGGIQHLFSFIWIGGVVAMSVGVLAIGRQDSGAYLFFVLLVPFLALGIWMHAASWIERIELGPEGIKWVDWKGAVRVEAPLNEIVTLDETRSSNEDGVTWFLRIYTKRGAVKASSYLRPYSKFKAEIQAVLNSRRP